MAKLETMFCVATWALMNVLLVTMAFETAYGASDLEKAHVASSLGARAA